MEMALWAFGALILYAYAGYPLLLVLRRAVGGTRPVASAPHHPTVTLLVSAFNEEKVIAEKIRNSLMLDYPRDKLQIIVISDASDDRTDAIVIEHAEQDVALLRMADRGGKTLGLNAGVREAGGEVVVFSDANAMYLPDALLKLTRNFADPRVGAVVGESTYVDAEGGAQRSESLYWRYETAIKRLESHVGSVVGGDGAIYAIRRVLYRDMRADALSDFVNPMQIVSAGYRCVYEPEARCIEEAAEGFEKEFRRKVRIVNRAWRATWTLPELLNPFRFGWFSLQFVSHKLLRWLMPVFLIAFLLVSAALFDDGTLYAATFAAQALLYALAALGYLMRRRDSLPRVVAVPFYFCLVNLACMRGIIEAYRGRTYTTWSTPRANSSLQNVGPKQ